MGIFHDDALNSLGYSLGYSLIFLKYFVHLFWVFPLIFCSGALSPARARLTRGLNCISSVYADGHTVNGPPEDQLQHQAADGAGEGVPLQQVPERARRAGVSGALQLSETQVKVWVWSTRTKFTEGAAARCRGTRTHSWTPAPLLDQAIPPNTRTPPVCAGVPPLDADRKERTGNFPVQIGSNQSVIQPGGTGLHIKIQVIPLCSCERTTKMKLIGHKDKTDCLC